MSKSHRGTHTEVVVAVVKVVPVQVHLPVVRVPVTIRGDPFVRSKLQFTMIAIITSFF